MGEAQISWIVVLPCCIIPVLGLLATWVIYRTGRRSPNPPAHMRSRWEGLSQDQAFGGDNGKRDSREIDPER